MSLELDEELADTGTRFRVFPQPRFLTAFAVPETIAVSVRPADIQDGPADDRMYVVDAVNKQPYTQFTLPPYEGPANPAVEKGEDGHFDHLDPDSREFACAAMYATVRRVLDIWEGYVGHPVAWHFESAFARLELIPMVSWGNAQSGYGFLEFGYPEAPTGGLDLAQPYCLNFDVLAHELGHGIVFSLVGFPSAQGDPATDYFAMHEAGGDLVAIIAALHFDSVVDVLLEGTRGNLFTVNELERVGELSASHEIRAAFNSLRMSDVGTEAHDRSRPLTGGVFDVLVEVFQKNLVAAGLITPELAVRSTQGPGPGRDQDLDAVQDDFDAAYTGNEAAFATALLQARDTVGRILARAWDGLNPNFLTFHQLVRRLMWADRELNNNGAGDHQETIRECFAWREINPLPGSLLLRPHTVRACALPTRTAPPAAPRARSARTRSKHA